MKRLMALFAIGLLFYACSENTNLVDPLDQHNSTISPRQSKSSVAWLTNPSSKSNKFIGLDQANGLQVIDLTTGGDVTANFVSADGQKTISATLHVPAGALKNRPSLQFHMVVDNDQLTIQFQPHPTIFDIPLTMDLEYTGVDLTGIDAQTVYFAYLDNDMTSWVIPNEKIFVDKNTGTLRITGGEIPHFSEYGFVRRTDDSTSNP
ncbi:MAG: hypothetical protein NTX65_03340 [Ignavibacteriales bacterium]|nr:hypothetical protein [Ignavibacteriales bacterium]